MNILKKQILFPLIALLLSSCGLDENEPYNLKFIHIMLDETTSTTISAKANTIGTYSVYLSSARATEPVEVTYKIEVGDGLQAGIDYNLITTGNTLTFYPGIYDMPVRIQWLSNENLDASKDNSIKIVLLSNNKGYSIGLPGPDHNQSSFTITKVLK